MTPWPACRPLRAVLRHFCRWKLITGCQMPEPRPSSLRRRAPTSCSAIVAFPAISLFVLLGATVFSVAKIRNIREENGSGRRRRKSDARGTTQWWHDHQWGVWLVFAATIAMAWFGATWLLFLFYIVSFGLLLYVLTCLRQARSGESPGDRPVLSDGPGSSRAACRVPRNRRPGHSLCRSASDCPCVLWRRVGSACSFSSSMAALNSPAAGPEEAATDRWVGVVRRPHWFPLSAWFMNPILWPATPARIKAYVESFDRSPLLHRQLAPMGNRGELGHRIEAEPRSLRPRRLLAQEISGEQNPFILGSAFRVGLVRIDQLGQLKDYESRRHFLLDDPIASWKRDRSPA